MQCRTSMNAHRVYFVAAQSPELSSALKMSCPFPRRRKNIPRRGKEQDILALYFSRSEDLLRIYSFGEKPVYFLNTLLK